MSCPNINIGAASYMNFDSIFVLSWIKRTLYFFISILTTFIYVLLGHILITSTSTTFLEVGVEVGLSTSPSRASTSCKIEEV